MFWDMALFFAPYEKPKDKYLPLMILQPVLDLVKNQYALLNIFMPIKVGFHLP